MKQLRERKAHTPKPECLKASLRSSSSHYDVGRFKKLFNHNLTNNTNEEPTNIITRQKEQNNVKLKFK